MDYKKARTSGNIEDRRNTREARVNRAIRKWGKEISDWKHGRAGNEPIVLEKKDKLERIPPRYDTKRSKDLRK